MKEFSKLELLMNICKFFNYKVIVKCTGEIICDGTELCKDFYFEYSNIEDALINWLDTLEESTKGYDEDSKDTWKDEIEFIKELKFNNMTKEEVGKEIAKVFSSIEFYEFVKWDEIEDIKYIEFVNTLEKNIKTFNKVKNYLKNDDGLYASQYFSDEEYYGLEERIDNILLRDNYYLADGDDRFFKKPTVENMIEFLKEHNIDSKEGGLNIVKVNLGYYVTLDILLDDDENYYCSILLDDCKCITDSPLKIVEFLNDYKDKLSLKDKAYNIVKDWLNSYNYRILDKKTLWGLEFLHVEDLENAESNTDLTLGYWCDFFINEINHKLSHDTEKEIVLEWTKEKNIMQQYLDNENKIKKDNCDLEYKVYKIVKTNISHKNIELLQILVDNDIYLRTYDNESEDISTLSYWCKDVIGEIDYQLKYGEKDMKETFIEEQKILQQYLNRDKKDEIAIETTNNSLQIKYDICLKYERKINGCMHHISFTTGIPFVTRDSELLIATGVLGRTYDDKFAIDEIYCKKEVICISKLKYWLGLSHQELFEQIDVLVKENDIKEYIELGCGTRIPVSCIEDVLKIKSDMDDEIKDYHVEDKSLNELLKIHKGNSLSLFLADVDELFRFVKHNKKAFDKLIELDSDCNNWLNGEIFYYDMKKDLAIECYLEEECNIPSNVIYYMEIDKYIKNELNIKIIEGEDFTVIDSY